MSHIEQDPKMNRSPRFRFFLWHKLLFALGGSMVLLGLILFLTTTSSLQSVGQEIGEKSQDILATQTEKFLATIIAGQGDTIDLQLNQAQISAIHGAKRIEHFLQQGQAPTPAFLSELLKNAGDHAITVYFFSVDGDTHFFPERETQQHSEHPESDQKTHLRLIEKSQPTADNVFWLEPHKSHYSAQYDRVTDAIVPVSVDGEHAGYLGISVSVIRLVAQFNHRQTIRGSYTYLLNQGQGLISGPPHATFDLTPKDSPPSGRGVIDLSETGNDELDDILSDMVLGNISVQRIQLNDKLKYIAYRPISHTGWSIGLTVPVILATAASEEIVELVENKGQAALQQMILAILLFSGMALLIIGIISRRMTRPLLEMAEVADHISHGELDRKIDTTGSDEIGGLAQSLNAMTQQLKQYIGSLQKQQQELSESESRYKALFHNSPISLWEEDFSRVKRYLDDLQRKGVSDIDYYFQQHPEKVLHCAKLVRIKDVNQATMDLYGASSKSDLLGNLPKVLPNESLDVLKEEIVSMFEGKIFERECTNHTLHGETLTIAIRSLVPPGFEESWKKVFVAVNDITDRARAEKEKKQLESQLRQSYKMEAIGTLAGGIAHDFNNILSAIIGYSELIMSQDDLDDDSSHYSSQVLTAASRAKDLVNQILAFSRHSEQETSPVSVKHVVTEALQLLRASLPATINIHQEIHTDGIIWGNATQVHQIIMNLCTNAAQAMQENGGTLTIILSEERINPQEIKPDINLQEDEYINLRITDTGHGMNEETLSRIFDPYFTTRGRQQGTGMGLAVVHGIIQSYGGFIKVSSKHGKGSCFELFLPKADMAEEIKTSKENETIPGGDETILFVDDELPLAELARMSLQNLGYKVVTHTDSLAALEEVKKDPERFDLVVSDMTMPEMTGDKLASAIHELNPDLPVIICSGYTDKMDQLKDNKDISGFLMKPLGSADLAHNIRKVLDN